MKPSSSPHIRPAGQMRSMAAVAGLSAYVVALAASPASSAPVDPGPARVQVVAVSVETATPPGSPHSWTRFVCLYRTAAPWEEGIVFSFQALAMAEGRPRILTGVARYANVCAGMHRALLYLSPAATRRFGAPRAVRVEAFVDDEEIDAREWRAGVDVPAGWRALYDRRRGLLLPSPQTPWFAADIDPGADALSLPP